MIYGQGLPKRVGKASQRTLHDKNMPDIDNGREQRWLGLPPSLVAVGLVRCLREARGRLSQRIVIFAVSENIYDARSNEVDQIVFVILLHLLGLRVRLRGHQKESAQRLLVQGYYKESAQS
jgi:hypothetical protein